MRERISKKNILSIVGLILSFGSIAVLFFFFRHSAGYNERATLFVRVKGLWLADDGAWLHGAFVLPIIAGLLLWKRDYLRAIPRLPANTGLFVIVVALFCYWIGYKANMHYFGFGGIQLLAAGIVLWLYGWKVFRAVFFHLCFMSFMWPVIFLDEELAVPLRYFMVDLSSSILSLLGIENLRVGTAIISAGDPSAGIEQGSRFQLDVANPCSGIRSLFALMMISALFGYVSLQGFWRRVLLFVASLPLAVVGNIARILMLAFGSLWFGSDFAIGEDGSESTYHLLSGFLVFGVALFGLVGISALLKGGIKGSFASSVTVVRKNES